MKHAGNTKVDGSKAPSHTTGRIANARVSEIDGAVWLTVRAPNGNSGMLNLNALQCGPIVRKAFVDWARGNIERTHP